MKALKKQFRSREWSLQGANKSASPRVLNWDGRTVELITGVLLVNARGERWGRGAREVGVAKNSLGSEWELHRPVHHTGL